MWLWAILLGCSVTAKTPSTGSPASHPGAPAASTSSKPSSVVTAGELRVGTSGDYAPFSIRDASGKTTGFDVELAEELARDLGLRLRWVPFRWPELGKELAAGAFDVAMGGITWQAARAVSGYMTRTVGRGGPCVLGDETARRIAVNRGGVLEVWARGRFGDRELMTVDDNRSLPALLEAGQVGAIVTDSFERASFHRRSWATRCEPARSQKVYWVGPARARELGERMDAWLRANPARVHTRQERWFGERQRLDANAHLIDLIARRFAFMPLIGALKAQKSLAVEDRPREREVLDAIRENAKSKGLPEDRVVALFALQIELSKAVQRRQHEASSLDLTAQIRPALNELGHRILDALTDARASGRLGELALDDLELVSPWLTAEERTRLLAALRAVGA